jgi:catechol 2,3-dioxygenase-like lactoylglutathione lyase family enzyme
VLISIFGLALDNDKEGSMPKIRHIAYRANDVEAMANFFTSALSMTIVQRRKNGAIDLSDGTMNITLLPSAGRRTDGAQQKQGIDHIGFTVENEEETSRRLESAGATKLDPAGYSQTANFETKFLGPEGIGIDLGHWIGAAPLDKSDAAK